MEQHVPAVDLLQGFRNRRTLAIGDAMLDTYLEGSATRLCSEGPVPVVSKTAEYRIPGGAANTAANLCALGADVALLGIVGTDLAASLLRAALTTHNVDDRWLVADALFATLHKLRVVANGQYVVRFDEGGIREQIAPLADPCQQSLLAHLETLYRWCDLVVVSDYGYGATSDQLIARLHTLHAQQPKLIFVDSKTLHRFRMLPATVVTPNYVEANALIAHVDNTFAATRKEALLKSSELEHVGRRVLDSIQAEHIAVTLGAQGVAVFHRDAETLHVEAQPVQRADDVGAGDSFIAGMALALAAGGGVEAATRLGIDAAAIAVAKQRTAIVRYQELMRRVSMREHAVAQAGRHSSIGPQDVPALAVYPHTETSAGPDDEDGVHIIDHNHKQATPRTDGQRQEGAS